MIKLEEIGKSHMPCRFCNGTGMNDWSVDKRITLFGMNPDEIMKMWRFAQEHGYKSREPQRGEK